VATLQRSGSNLLADLMAGTGVLGFPNEYFNPRVLTTVFPGRGQTAADSCLLARECGMSPNGVLAFKLFPEHFFQLQRGVKLSEWFGTPRWIWLRRRDLLGQAISLLMAQQTGSFTTDMPERARPMYDAGRIGQRLEDLAARDAIWATYFARSGIEPLRLWYEDVAADPPGAVRAVARFLEVELPAMASTSAATRPRQSQEMKQEWRARFLHDHAGIDRLEWTQAPTQMGRLVRGFARRISGSG
jgi:LPS sulfotransferase NodH